MPRARSRFRGASSSAVAIAVALFFAVGSDAMRLWGTPAVLSSGDLAVDPELAGGPGGDALVVWDQSVGGVCASQPDNPACVHIVEAASRTPGAATFRGACRDRAPRGRLPAPRGRRPGRERSHRDDPRHRRGSRAGGLVPTRAIGRLARADGPLRGDAPDRIACVRVRRSRQRHGRLGGNGQRRPNRRLRQGAPDRLGRLGRDAPPVGRGGRSVERPEPCRERRWRPRRSRTRAGPAGTVVQAAIRPASSGVWSPPADLSAPGADPDPSVAIDGAGDAVAVWSRGVVESSYRRSDGWWSGPVVVSGREVRARDPQVALDGAGNAVAIWLGPREVESAARPYASAAWSSPVVVDRTGGAMPRLAIEPSGNAVAAWVDDAGATRAALRPSATGRWTASETVSQRGAGRAGLVSSWAPAVRP